MQNGTRLVALDLGSNSFRLEIGQLDHGHIRRVEYLKETVRQGNGLDESRNLTPEAMQRGWDCLARFGERLSGCRKSQVRAVATQTLREAKNRDEFIAQARKILGFPIDVISGREEARLIYQGVVRTLPATDTSTTERRLVVDIGGRSTEMILGHGFDAQVMESYRLGSVSWSMRYFENGQFTAKAFESAAIAARAVLDEALTTYARANWDVAYGASGTIAAVGDVLAAAGRPPGIVTREGLAWLKERLLKAGSADKLKIEGMKDDRRAVIGGGLTVLTAVFDLLDIEEMHAADGALRHGVLYDLVEREQEETDLRSASVERMAARFGVDTAHGKRVTKVAQHLFGQLFSQALAVAKDPAPAEAGSAAQQLERFTRKVKWAAQLHEIGCHISHNYHHKHGAYILQHAEVPGFALPELRLLSQLVLGQRGKLKKLDLDLSDPVFVQQLLCLRLASTLCHARRDPDYKGLQLAPAPKDARAFVLSCPPGWADAWPQSAYLLREEANAWRKTPWSLELVGCDLAG
ncbi:MAG: Ppx/GppA phosphatase family protein [Burkholderiales bacterium]